MNITVLNPYIRYCRRHMTPFIMRTETSKCYDCRLFFFDNTPGTIFIGEEKYKITNKTAVFLPPETEYKISIDFKDNFTLIIMDFDLTSDNSHINNSLNTATVSSFDKSLVPAYTLCKEFSKPIVKEISQIEQTLIRCTENFIFKNEYYRETSSAFLKLALLEMVKATSEISHSELCRKVLDYIYLNFSNPDLTNEDIATHFNYHPYHLSNIIKKETGKTLHQFLMYYRLRNAKDLLSSTDYDISHIAFKSGFISPAHFTYAFRKNSGITPREYRKQKPNFTF